MNRALAVIGVVTLGGGLSLCGLCGTTGNTTPRVGGPGYIAVANAAPVPLARSAVPMTATLVSPEADTKTIALVIKGMTCGGCVIGVRTVLMRLPGVSKADVSYKASRAVVTYDPAVVTVDQMIAAIRTLGYTATVVAG